MASRCARCGRPHTPRILADRVQGGVDLRLILCERCDAPKAVAR